MKKFQESLPDGFYTTLSKKVITMENKKTNAQVVKIYNIELIYCGCFHRIYQIASVYLIFHRCRVYSIKRQTRLERLGQYARTHTLTMDTSLPTRKATLEETRTKILLINFITRAILHHCTSIKCQNALIVTCQ